MRAPGPRLFVTVAIRDAPDRPGKELVFLARRVLDQP
jgi:hypothetical protein